MLDIRRRTMREAALLLGALSCGALATAADGVNDRLQLKPKGYFQVDFRSFGNWETEIGKVNLARDTFELRRLRLGLEGSYRALRFELDVDLSGEDDALDDALRGYVPRDFFADDILRDAFVDWRSSRKLRVRAGRFKIPFFEEQLISASRIDFTERSMATTALVPGRDLGLMAHGRLSDKVAYEAGVFAGDDRLSDSRSGITGAARVVYTPATALLVGVAATLGDVKQENGDSARGMPGRCASGYRFFAAHHVDGRRLRAGLEAAWTPGRVALKVAAVEGRDARQGQGASFEDLPDLVGRGWSASAHFLLNGHRRRGFVEPGQGLFHGMGTIEASLRYEQLLFDDAGSATGLSSASLRAADVRDTSASALTAGLSWWPTRWMRLIGNASWERFGSGDVAPEQGRSGDYFTLSTRLQFRLP